MKKFYTLIVIFSLAFSNNGFAQEKTISGKVTSKTDGALLPGVSVIVQGTTKGTETDFDGKYTIKANVGDVLSFSYLGMKEKTVTVTGSNTIDVSLEDGENQLDEIVVTALGISREKKSLGYAVSNLKGASVSLAKEANVVNSLAGKVAGVVITQSTSGSAGGTRVVIRGNNSITGNNQPLYVVDGVPIDNSGNGSANGNGTSEFSRNDLGTGISDINPDDIESMSILKGPNAAALYGSRASNGVILITTKKGGTGKGLGISFTSNISMQDPLLLPEYQNQYGAGVNGAFAADLNQLKGAGSWGPKFDGSQQLYYTGENRAYSAQPNNVKNFFRTGSNIVNTIAISKATENSSLRFSYSNSKINEILPNSSVDRNNFNLRGFSKITDKFSIDAKVTYFLQDAKNRASQGTEGIMAYLYGLRRNIDINDLKNYQDLSQGYGVIAPTNSGGNPYWILNEDNNEDTRKRFTGFAKAQYEFNSNFKAFVRVGTDVIDQQTERYQATGHHFKPLGTLGYNTYDTSETNYDFLMMYNKDINDDFSLTANFGGNALHATSKFSSIYGEEFKIPGKQYITNTNPERLRVSQSELVEKKVHSLYGSASLSYKGMAYLDITGRNDWSSALAAENRSYFYNSASLSLLLNKMFNIESENINFTKLRLSYAKVGNDTDAHQIVNLFNVAANGYLGNISVAAPTTKFSKSLKPEDVTSTEIGFEIKAFKNRLFADFAYYSINSKDLIFNVPVDPATGFQFFRQNVGEITNKGFEVMIGGTPIRNENFDWSISANIAGNKNKLESLIDGQDFFQFTTSNNGVVDVRAQVGEGFGDIYGTDWLRTDDGKLLLTAAGRPQATSERVKLGNYQPDFTGGITNTFNYKNFSLNFLVDFRIGGQIYSATDAALDNSGASIRSLKYRDGGVTLDGVIDNNGTLTQNTTNITAQEYWGSASGVASEYVYDQTNARLREVSATYRLSSKALQDTFINAASVSLTGRNLFFFFRDSKNFDPESSYSTSNFAQGVLYYNLPTTSSVGLSLNIKF
ncbi:SusC/RagA family TonB-linked outer membrane protein [Polaribacter haliotis]|uniref:SusC/RagA family TonB-linked outer membrane protein n=1 Tax=Polaribacter haliotis TaxID=1888915 RepID=A0A7L8ACY3_9FLAO|nr:SusC/RagA family TonB-linked outer membrane protein [Polaribacter haliotis]QOD59873.1 SusC/RagA family TonB-linked outer membrane protein [Polaribacter haliotis]